MASYITRDVTVAYWHQTHKRVKVPLADFFGLGLGEYFNYRSAMTNVAPAGGFDCYFSMPFEKSALITVTHDHNQPIERLYFQADHLALTDLLPGVGNFHAQYRQNDDGTHQLVKHEDGSLEHTVVQAEPCGHFVGFAFFLIAAFVGSWESIREMLSLNLDGSNQVLLDDGARTSDGPDCLSPHSYTYSRSGQPYVMFGDNFVGRFSRYRWPLEGPPSFKRMPESSLRIRHDFMSDLTTYSVGYWYQKEPHKKFPPFPPAGDRILPMVAAGVQQKPS